MKQGRDTRISGLEHRGDVPYQCSLDLPQTFVTGDGWFFYNLAIDLAWL